MTVDAVQPSTLEKQCVARTTAGPRCKRRPIRGGTVCKVHGGGTPAVRRKALVRAEIEEWGLGNATVDPGETLLRLVSQSAARVAFYGDLLRQAYAVSDADEYGDYEMPKGIRALIGKQYRVTEDGDRVEVGEAIRGLVSLEMQERKLCADFAEKAIRAGLAERQVRVAEAQGVAVIGAIMAALDRAGVVGPARLEAQNAAADYLGRVVEGG